MKEYKNLKEIVKQLEWCGYECEYGPLINNVAFIKLKELADKEDSEEILNQSNSTSLKRRNN